MAKKIASLTEDDLKTLTQAAIVMRGASSSEFVDTYDTPIVKQAMKDMRSIQTKIIPFLDQFAYAGLLSVFVGHLDTTKKWLDNETKSFEGVHTNNPSVDEFKPSMCQVSLDIESVCENGGIQLNGEFCSLRPEQMVIVQNGVVIGGGESA